MISYNCQVSFKSFKLLNKQFKSSRTLNCSLTTPSETVINQPNPDEQISNKFNTFTKVSGYLGMLAGSIAAFKGIKILMNKPSKANKQLIEILENRLISVNSSIKTIRELFEDTYFSYAERLKELKPKQSPFPDIIKIQTELEKSENISEIFKIENNYIEDLNNWLELELNKNNSPEVFSKVYELQEQFRTKISEYKQTILKQIQSQNNITEIPEKLTKGKKAKNIIAVFKDTLDEKIQQLTDDYNYVDSLFNTQVISYFADRQKVTGQLMSEEKTLIQNFLVEVKKKLSSVISRGTSQEKINLLPTETLRDLHIPESILNHPIHKFLNNPDTSLKKYTDFVFNMSETLNLKDIKIYSERLRLRDMAGATQPYNPQQLNTLADETEKLHEACGNILLKLFKESGKNLDLNNINIKEIETSALRLSRSFGFKSIGEMITNLLAKYSPKAEISESTISKIYKKYNERFLENLTSDLIEIKMDTNNLFNWSTLE